MKYIKTYNEKLADKLLPPSDDEIMSKLKTLSNYDRLYQSLNNKYIDGVKISLDKKLDYKTLAMIIKYVTDINRMNVDIIKLLLSNEQIRKSLNENLLYLLEKYYLNIHQDVQKDYEKWLYEKLNNTEQIPYRKVHGNYFYYSEKPADDGNIILTYLPKEKSIYVNYYDLWLPLQNNFHLNYEELKILFKFLISDVLNVEIENVYQSSI